MAQDLFRVEIGLADDNVHYLSGSGAPSGTLAAAAPVGSKWSDTADGTTYTRGVSGWVALATGGDASALLTEVNTIETSVGLNSDGTLTYGGTPGNFLGTDSVVSAISKIDLAVTATEVVANAAAAAVAQEILDRQQALINAAAAQVLVDNAQNDAIALKVAKSGDTMTGNLAFGGTHTVTGLSEPLDPTDAATKNYVDNAIVGISWKVPVGSIGASNPATASLGDRFLNTTDSKIYTATGVNTWGGGVVPADGWAVFDKSTETGYIFDGAAWVQFTGGGQITDGVGLKKTGNQLDVNLGAGVAQLPSDEVGIDVRANSGLWLTEDGLVSSQATDAQLGIKLDGTSLSLSIDGIKLSTTLQTAISNNTQAIIDEANARGLAVTAEADARILADGVLQTAINTANTMLAKARTETQVLASTSAAMGGVLVDAFETAKWIVTVRGTGANADKKSVVEVLAIHNGTAAADATQVDYTVYAKLKIGGISGLTFVVATSGTGAGQTMALTVSATNAVDVSAIREVAGF